MKKKYPSDKLAVVHVRMSHELHRALKEKAKSEGRSISSEAVQILSREIAEAASQQAA